MLNENDVMDKLKLVEAEQKTIRRDILFNKVILMKIGKSLGVVDL